MNGVMDYGPNVRGCHEDEVPTAEVTELLVLRVWYARVLYGFCPTRLQVVPSPPLLKQRP